MSDAPNTPTAVGAWSPPAAGVQVKYTEVKGIRILYCTVYVQYCTTLAKKKKKKKKTTDVCVCATSVCVWCEFILLATGREASWAKPRFSRGAPLGVVDD